MDFFIIHYLFFDVDVERIHTRFCRSLLGVKKSTNLAALYFELGRKPLPAFRKIRILKYWSKIIHTENDLLSRIYIMLLNDTNNGNTYTTQSLIRAKILILFAGGPAYLIPNILG